MKFQVGKIYMRADSIAPKLRVKITSVCQTTGKAEGEVVAGNIRGFKNMGFKNMTVDTWKSAPLSESPVKDG